MRKKKYVPLPCALTALKIASNNKAAARILKIPAKRLFKKEIFENIDHPNYAHTTYPVIVEREYEFMDLAIWPPKYNNIKDTVGPCPGMGLFRY